jgi:phosphate transport system permease protein
VELGRALTRLGEGALSLVALASSLAVLLIFYSIISSALPFFVGRGEPDAAGAKELTFHAERAGEFFTGTEWEPQDEQDPHYGALTVFFGSLLVTLGAMVVAVPMGVVAAVSLSDIVPWKLRQSIKPIIEMLAAIPSVVYGFFALMVVAPLLQSHGGSVLGLGVLMVGLPLAWIAGVTAGDLTGAALHREGRPPLSLRLPLTLLFGGLLTALVLYSAGAANEMVINSGRNALNVSVILGIMALPTVVSVSEDALSAVGRSLREASYGLGATRAETLIKVVIPAARSGIMAAILLGVMRAVGETMVVLMAAGKAEQIPEPWYNLLEPITTLTATIAGEMGEASHMQGNPHYSVLFALALCLLLFCFVCNLVSEWVASRAPDGIE